MKAIVVEEFGPVEELKLKEVNKPKIGKNQLLVENYAFSINPVEWKMREGNMGGDLPMILGGDLAGVVSEVGSEVTNFNKGDKVFAKADNSYAEFVAVEASVVARIPEGISFNEAAAVPLTGQTAWEALVERGQLKEGEKVLIHAGAGGVGSMAIQIAKHFGAYVASTASKDNEDFLLSLGVNQFIDYQNEDFEQISNDFDIVLDSIGGETQEKSFSVLKKGGRLVSLLEEPDEEKLKEYEVEGIQFLMNPSGERLEKLADLMANEELVPTLSKTYSFTETDVQRAHELNETGHTRGKIIVSIK